MDSIFVLIGLDDSEKECIIGVYESGEIAESRLKRIKTNFLRLDPPTPRSIRHVRALRIEEIQPGFEKFEV